MNSHHNEINRSIKVISGQLLGISKMLDENRDFTEIIVQLSSIKSAIDRVENLIVTKEIKSDKKTMELIKLISRKFDSLKKLNLDQE